MDDPSLTVLYLQSKRRFERDCKEADRAQQYFEKMDADINVTKADVEKVRGLGLASLERASLGCHRGGPASASSSWCNHKRVLAGGRVSFCVIAMGTRSPHWGKNQA